MAAYSSATLIAATSGDATGLSALWTDPSHLVDIALFVGCAAGMLYCSRIAAVTVFAYFILSKATILLGTGQIAGVLTVTLLVVCFGRTIQGAFALRSWQKTQEPGYRAAPPWFHWYMVPTMTLFLAAAGYDLVAQTAGLKSSGIVAGVNLSDDDRSLLVEKGVIYDDESIELLHTRNPARILKGGSILSDRAVIMYYTDEDDGFNVYEVAFEHIRAIELIERGKGWADSTYKVTGSGDQNWVTLSLSPDNNSDIVFINALHGKQPLLSSNLTTD